ncbi:MAG: SIS domain-containing protein [Paludibacteraceae bacterium]|nr:SIS domain-containing protein [Paludibacteraceae bacterium]
MANTGFTFNEIHQQPAMWRKELAALLAKKEEIRAFMHKYLTPDTDIVLTGAGTSAFIGDALQPVMRGMWRNVRSVPTTDIVTHAKYLLDEERPLLLISFARSGNSPESVAAVNLANKVCKNVAHVYITCNKNGKLAKQANGENGDAALNGGKDNILLLLLPEETDDKSLAMTSSFSTMLLTCLMLGHIDTLDKDQEMIEKTAKNAEAVMAEYEDKLKEIASRPFERGVFLGSGALKGIAEECHLKLQELTDGAVVCKFDSFLGFRHGPKAVVNSKSIVVYLMTEQEDVQRYERDLVKQVDANNTPVAQIIVIAGKAPELPGVKADLVVRMPYGPEENDFYGIVAYVLVGQLLGYYASLAHGLNPDAPSVSGNIHRVVEGVTIYE